MIDPKLLEILRCPTHPDAGPLTVQGELLVCPLGDHGYRVIDGIPRMLPEDAVTIEASSQSNNTEDTNNE